MLAKAVDSGRGCFTQHYGTSDVDAALLLLPAVGFVAGDDPRMLATIEAVEHDLLRDGLVLRYRTTSGVDGLSGDEHPFLACSFWLVSAYALAGRHDEATALMERLVALGNDVGLLSEEYDAGHGRMVGNFPQAFSHLALVQAARGRTPCYFDPSHGEGVIAVTWRAPGTRPKLGVRVCPACATAVRERRAPDVVLDHGRPYYEAATPWAETGYGQFGDLVGRILARE